MSIRIFIFCLLALIATCLPSATADCRRPISFHTRTKKIHYSFFIQASRRQIVFLAPIILDAVGALPRKCAPPHHFHALLPPISSASLIVCIISEQSWCLLTYYGQALAQIRSMADETLVPNAQAILLVIVYGALVKGSTPA